MSPPPASSSALPLAAPPCATPVEDHGAWFREEVYKHDSSLKAYLRNRYPSVADVEDVIQESYLRVWRTRLSQQIRSTKSFLFQVARNAALDVIRHNRRSPIDSRTDSAICDVLDDGPGIVETACSRDEIVFLTAAIAHLPEKCRRVMLLRQIDGFSQKEICELTGLSENTVQSHISRGLRRLEEYMRERKITR